MKHWTLLAALAVALGLWAQTGLAEQTRPKPRPDVGAAAPADDTALPAELSSNPRREVIQTSATAAPARAVPAPQEARDPSRGAVTNLPLPRYVSLKTNEGNARRGPGLTHRIDWMFTKAGMPLKLTAEHENWRRVEDAEGLGGWMHYSLLSGVRTVLIKGDLVDFHTSARPDATIAFRAEGGVIGRVMECDGTWCRINIDGEKGWAPIAALWGVAPGEVID